MNKLMKFALLMMLALGLSGIAQADGGAPVPGGGHGTNLLASLFGGAHTNDGGAPSNNGGHGTD